MTKTYSGKQFSWSGNMGISEASALEFPVNDPPDLISVRSHRTGRTLSFGHVRTMLLSDEGSYHVYESKAGVILRVFED